MMQGSVEPVNKTAI